MPSLAQYSAELDALVRDGRRIRLGNRNVERTYEQLEELLVRLDGLSARMRGDGVAKAPTGCTLSCANVTGRGQILRVVAGKPRG